ncbi:MAG: metallophosphoesterase, partial [Flavobacteriales bacterium]
MIRVAVFLITLTFIGAVFDIYFYLGVKGFFNSNKTLTQFKNIYWSVSAFYYLFALVSIVFLFFGMEANRTVKIFGQIIFFVLFVPKILASSFLIIDDLIRVSRLVLNLIVDSFSSKKEGVEGISRLKFLQLSALGSFGVLLGSLTYGVIKGGYRYTVKNQKITIPNLPDEFKGLKIAQISDLHVGSFMSLEPMKEAVNKINEIDVDMLFFTGDLVNDKAEEAIDFIDVFKKIKHKVYSIMGNHDYPEYIYAEDDYTARQHNYDLMQEIQGKMNFELLLNENRIIERNGKKLAILGVENWGGSFSKYGDLSKALKG